MKFSLLFGAKTSNLEALKKDFFLWNSNNSYIFLISTRPDILLDTIKSRMYKLTIHYPDKLTNDNYEKVVKILVSHHPKFQRIKIDKFTNNINEISDKKIWLDVCNNIRLFILRIIKFKMENLQEFYFQEENTIFDNISLSISELIYFYQEIEEILNDSYNQDLDNRQVLFILAHKFSSLT